MYRFLEQSPDLRIFNWPVKYKVEGGNESHQREIELKVRFGGQNDITLTDNASVIYSIRSSRGYTVVGTSPYGGYHSECFFYRAVGQLGEIDLFSVIPINDVKFNNLKRTQILLPGPIRRENIVITPKPLTMFQQFNFSLISRRIHNTLRA